MLRADLHNYSGEVNKIQKSLGAAIYTVPFTFLDNYDLQNPHIILTLAGNDANGIAMQAYMAFLINYVVIYDSDNAAFRKQYYFVDKVIWQTNELLEFVLRKDVLTTYATSIVNLEGLLERCEDSSFWTPNVVDEYVPFTKEYKLTQTNKGSFLPSLDTPEEVWLILNVIQDTFSPNESGTFSHGDFEDDGKVDALSDSSSLVDADDICAAFGGGNLCLAATGRRCLSRRGSPRRGRSGTTRRRAACRLSGCNCPPAALRRSGVAARRRGGRTTGGAAAARRRAT